MFALLVGAFLLIEGVWGLTSPVVFGVLTTNTLHAIIHIVLGIVGIAAGWQRRARGFCIFLGILLLAVGVLRFVPGVDEIIIGILNVNVAVACVNIAVGAVALLLALVVDPPVVSNR
ncbi:MAG: DUF4383 domain-containing protein [Chthoniobacterales bacterium]|nr:DUF4383 domain-containing protein [Chthoniobacterales bacterium]